MKAPRAGRSPGPTRAELLAENQKLRRDIDHRVRNSLQVVASLIDMTARAAVDPAALAVLQVLRARLSAMIAVYRTLDDVPHRAIVNMDETLRHLVDQVSDTSLGGAMKHEARIQAQGVLLALDDAMPVALMVIEVLLASALNVDIDSTGPTATVGLIRDGDEALLRIHLINAAGDALMPRLSGDALRIMKALAQQLGGPLMVDNDEGVTRTIEVRFPVRGVQPKSA